MRTVLTGVVFGTVLSTACLADSGVWRSADQLVWKESETKIEGGLSAPDVLHLAKPTPSRQGPDAGALLMYAIDGGHVVVARSVDQGRSWGTPERVVFNGWPKEAAGREGEAPSAVQLDDGRIRLYFVVSGSKKRRLPDWVEPPAVDPVPEAPMIPPPGEGPRMPKRPDSPLFPENPKGMASAAGAADEPAREGILSAVSNDGVTFAVEDGVRFDLKDAADPEVIRLAEGKADDGDTRRIGPWLMFVRRDSSVLLATSADGLTWSRDETFAWDNAGAPSAVGAAGSAPARSVRLFASRGKAVVSAVFDPATGKVTADSGDRVTGAGQDAAVSATGDGGWVLIRAGGAADKPRGPNDPPRRPVRRPTN